MRSIACLIVVASALLSSAQTRSGSYVPPGGSATPWRINRSAALEWGAQTYRTVGASIDATPESINLAKGAGLTDVVIDLPASGAGWQSAFDALKKADLRYLVRINSLAPMAHGYAVEPQGYRVSGITKSGPIFVNLPNATSAFIVLASRRDGSVQAAERRPVTGGVLTYDVKNSGTDLEFVLLIYPEMSSLEQPDYWDELDRHRDSLLTAFKKAPPGAGLRGIVNPMGKTINLPGKDLRFVPNSIYFQLELRKLLEVKYRNLATAVSAWSMSSSDFSTTVENKAVKGFDALARLVPLWSGSRGVSQLLDPVTDKLYSCDMRKSQAWKDIAEAVNAAAARRYDRLIRAIRSTVNVPIVQEWAGWAAPYEIGDPALDGLGMKAYGTKPSEITETAGRAASSLLRWANRGWLVASDVDLGSGDALKQLPNVVDDLFSLGAHAVFVRATDAASMKVIAAENAARNSTDVGEIPVPLYYPENATGTAAMQRLPGGRWWLPSPADGDTIDLGSQFRAYRIVQGAHVSFVVWALQPGRVKLLTAKPKALSIRSVDGSDPAPKAIKGGVEVTMGEFPLVFSDVDEIPVPAPALLEATKRFDDLTKLNETLKRDIIQETASFKDYIAGMDGNPGGNFGALQRVLTRMELRLSSFVWLEAEIPTDTNFSEALAIPGCSDGRALVLRTQLPSATGYTAEYSAPVRATVDQEVWIAARIPSDRRKDVKVVIGGQTLLFDEDPVSPYGARFAWYHLGTTKLIGSSMKLKLAVTNGSNSDIAIDAICITPRPFKPEGTRLPKAG